MPIESEAGTIRGDDLIPRAVCGIRERLPATWEVTYPAEPEGGDHVRDVVIASPSGEVVRMRPESRVSVAGRDIADLRDRGARAGRPVLVVARYLPRVRRDQLEAAGISYVDATGNMSISTVTPAMFLRDRGAQKDPWRSPGRPLSGLTGGPAAAVVRALVDHVGRWRTRDLIERTSVGTGSVYRVLAVLESEGLIERSRTGVEVIDWRGILTRWSTDYGFVRSNEITRWIAPRGLASLQTEMASTEGIGFAITGAVAADHWAGEQSAGSLWVYVPSDVAEIAAGWGLRPTERGVNVLIAKPTYGSAMVRTMTDTTGLRYAAPSQVAADLLTGPGRAPAAGESLMDWMGRNENVWRTAI